MVQVSMNRTSKNCARPLKYDTGWSWVVLCGGVVGYSIILGQALSFGSYFVLFLNIFEESRSYTAWIGSLNMAFLQIGGLTNGFFQANFGPKRSTILGASVAAFGLVFCSISNNVIQLLFYYGIFTAFGFAICIGAFADAVSKWFKKYLFQAFALTVTGGGIGIMIFPPLLERLMDEYGWRGTYLIQAGMSLHLVVVGFLFFDRNENDVQLTDQAQVFTIEPQRQTKPSKTSTWRNRFLEPRMPILALTILLQGFAFPTILVIYKDYAISKGLETAYPLTTAVLGMASIVGRFLPGLIATRCSPILLHIVISVLFACFLSANYYNCNWEAFVALGGLFGFCHGVFTTIASLDMADMFGRNGFASMFGYMFFCSGVGTLAGAPVTGLITDKTGSYFGSFLVSGILMAISTCLLILLYFINKCVKKKMGHLSKKKVELKWIHNLKS